jgi:hypothetical protein
MRRVGSVVALLSVLLVPAVASAQDDDSPPPLPVPAQPSPQTATTIALPGVDMVQLRSGGMYRGRVKEIVPGDHVTIVPEGQVAEQKIAWRDIEKVVVASAPQQATPVVAQPPASGPKARVHITTAHNVKLYRKPAGSDSWFDACSSPCDQDLPTGDTYKILGNNVPSSKEFHLEVGPSGFVDLVVDPPNHGGMILGGIIGGTGGLAFMVGSLMALVGVANDNLDCSRWQSQGQYFTSQSDCQSTQSNGKSVRNAGLVTLGIGAAVTGLGLVIIFNSATTDIDQHGGAARPARDAYLREPTFKSSGSSADAQFPLVFTRHF